MNDLKRGIKMMRYAYGIKTNLVQAGYFLLAGLVMIISGERGTFGLLGGFFWICIGILPSQLIYSVSVSNMVQASPMGRKMQTVVPVAVNLFCMLLIYLVEVLMCGIMAWRYPEQAGEIYWNLVIFAVMQVMMMVYLGLCYKHFVLATLVMIPEMVIWMSAGLDGWIYRQDFGANITLGMAVLAGFVLIAAGGLAEYLLTLAFYRTPMARMAQAAPLRKEL